MSRSAKCRTEAVKNHSRSTNLQNAKNHFIEVKIYENIKISDTKLCFNINLAMC